MEQTEIQKKLQDAVDKRRREKSVGDKIDSYDDIDPFEGIEEEWSLQNLYKKIAFMEAGESITVTKDSDGSFQITKD